MSNQAVVAASRDFVCARLITFEDGEEAKLMRRLLGQWNLVNTAFTIMDPAGKKQLVRADRSTMRAFSNANAMAREMSTISKKYPGHKKAANDDLPLPLLEDVRIGLNVTECDAQQLVIVRGTEQETQILKERLRGLCWSKELIGHFLYAVGGEATDWSVLEGADKAPKVGVLVVRTDSYGLTGKVVGSATADADIKGLNKMLKMAMEAHRPKPVDTRRLRRKGIRSGTKWQAEIRSSRGR